MQLDTSSMFRAKTGEMGRDLGLIDEDSEEADNEGRLLDGCDWADVMFMTREPTEYLLSGLTISHNQLIARTNPVQCN